MPRIYPAEASKVSPCKIDDDTLLAIGRLIRATAEIEDIVDCFIANLAGISESQALILVGRTAITRRLEIAGMLAKIRTDKSREIYKAAFPAQFDDLLECRNAMAHGVLMGMTDDGLFAFLTTPTSSTRGEAAVRIVASYSAATILFFAEAAEKLIPWLEDTLKVQEQRATRPLRRLSPHPKSQDRGRAKPQRPPRSSKG